MRFRKLRIAWSVLWGIACVLLIVLWVRSYWLKEQVEPSFGHSQVEQFMRDRPGVSEVIYREPVLREMLEANFEAVSTGGRVYWDEREPSSNNVAEHWPAYRDYPAMIRVSNGSDISAVDKCALLLFELYNVQSDKYFDSLTLMSVRDQMSKEDYANSVARGEFTAVKKTREFFRKHPLSDANINDNPHYHWLLEVPEEFSDYLRSFDDGAESNYLEWLRHKYDSMKSDQAR